MPTKKPHGVGFSRGATWIVRIGLSIILVALIYRIYGQIIELQGGATPTPIKPAAAAAGVTVHSDNAVSTVGIKAVKDDGAASPGADAWHGLSLME